MRLPSVRLWCGVGAAALAAAVASPTAVASAAPAVVGSSVSEPAAATGVDDLVNPLEEKRRALRQEALEQVVSGEAEAQVDDVSTVVKVGESTTTVSGEATRSGKSVDQYVELSRETTDKIFVILVEFGDERHPSYPDQDTDPSTAGPSTFDGPVHNSIPAPAADDNSTVWQSDFSAEYFRDLYFSDAEGANSVKNWYEQQSSGRYSVDGTVTDWVKVQYNEARYGRSNGYPCASSTCSNTWALVRDAANAWVADQEAAGRSAAEIAEELASFDVWDRYDHDGDGDFNEPDGYLDHFQIVHAGGDQADGDPYQGEDAIWSHRWYAYSTGAGSTGPEGNLLGGTQIGDTGLWIGDYTVQPENGGVSVFVHEYGHDLGLPDLYDTAGGANGVDWWSVMAQSRLSADGDQGIGTRAGDFGAWEKLQLGWLDYETVTPAADVTQRVVLGPHEYNTAKPQALLVTLPDKEVTTDLGAPAAGSKQWWSGSGDDLDTSMARSVDLTGAAAASLTFSARYDIEADYDYLYVEVSTDGGGSWDAVDGTVAGAAFVDDGSGTPAISGTQEDWADAVVPLDAYAGQEVLVRFHYRTDGGVAPMGFFADDVTVSADGAVVFADGAEDGPDAWAVDGFTVVGASKTQTYPNYYLASYRSYVGYDQYLESGPYNFGWVSTKPDTVEHFAYQEGLLVSYWDTSQADNNTSAHPGQGLILPVDAHPEPLLQSTGTPWRARVAGYDAPFSTHHSDSMTLHVDGVRERIRGLEKSAVFDDTEQYWFEQTPLVGVKLPATGTQITVVKDKGTSMTVTVGLKD